MLFMEAAAPGSVTPYLDPLPIGIFALLFLTLDAYAAPSSERLYFASSLIGAFVAGFAFILMIGYVKGRSDVLAEILLVTLLAGSFAFAWWPEKES